MFLGVSDDEGRLLCLIPRVSNTTAMGEGLNDLPVLSLSIIAVVMNLLDGCQCFIFKLIFSSFSWCTHLVQHNKANSLYFMTKGITV